MTIRPVISSILFSALVFAQQTPERHPDVPYVPTPVEVVEAMLKLADVHPGDVVYDLGCGDGRIVIMAAEKFGATGTGVDVDRERLADARENARKAGVSGKVAFLERDLFSADIRRASVVTLYLLPALNQKLRPKLLRDLKPGTRVVSFSFDMGDWKPDQTGDVNGRHIYLWVIPEKR